MTVLDNLLRLHRWQLEERQRYLADLELLADRLRADAFRLQQEAEEEARAGGVSLDAPDGARGFLLIRPLLERRRKLERSAAEIDGQVADARAAVEAAEQEVKMHEIGWSQRSVIPGGPLTRRARRTQEAQAQRARKLGS
jgi:flagellar FliJ protein